MIKYIPSEMTKMLSTIENSGSGKRSTVLAFTLAVNDCGLCFSEKPGEHSEVFTASFHFKTMSLMVTVICFDKMTLIYTASLCLNLMLMCFSL